MSPHMSRREFLSGLASLPFLALESSPLVRTISELQTRTMPNVLILVFDALSARHISVYGYNRETMPNLARFAEQSTVYHAHYAGGNHTSPGVASILTGTYPWSHRALHLHGTVTDDYVTRNLFAHLAPDVYHSTGYSHNLLVTSLLHQFHGGLDRLKRTRDLCLVDDQYADRLFLNDYSVAFWSEWILFREGESQPGSLIFSLLQRMLRMTHRKALTAEYGSAFPKGLPTLHSLRFILEHAVDWLQDELLSMPRPFLSYVHVLPPHEPYTTRHDFIDRFDDGWTPPRKAPHFFSEGHSDEFLNQQRREYDEYIAYADAEFGRLYDFMQEKGILDDTVVIVTSDHGELFERGIRGHVTPVLYEPVIHVPLLISKPGQPGREDVYAPTVAVDVLPTLLHVSGQPIPEWCEGEVLPTFSDAPVDGERSVFVVEAKGNPKQAPLTKGTVALIKGQYKLIRYAGYNSQEPEFELYDLDNDPEEMGNVYQSKRSVAEELQAELAERLRQANRPYLDG